MGVVCGMNLQGGKGSHQWLEWKRPLEVEGIACSGRAKRMSCLRNEIGGRKTF